MTDEQLREQFEAQRLPSYSQEVRDRLFEVDNLGQYTNHSMNSEWIGWKDGYAARDAEVQALRERNECLSRAVSFFASSIKSGEQWSAYHEEEMAALRGEEGSSGE